MMKTKISGWIKSIRTSKDITFLAITDGSRDHQLTVKSDAIVEGEFKVGASVLCEGFESTTPRGFDEIVAEKISVVGKSDEDYPIQPKQHSFDFLRTIPELRGRVKSVQGALKIRHHATQAVHRFFEAEGFYQYYTPIITHADCEGAGETFEVSTEWLKEKLTVSGQLHGEVGMMALGKIYTFSPCFRAEKSQTKKHLSEFWMIEPEAMFLDLKDAMTLSEKAIKFVLGYVLEKCEYEFKQMGIDTKHIEDCIAAEWKVIEYSDVCSEFGVKFGHDISTEIEKKVVEKFGYSFITRYPADLKPFYMKKEHGLAQCFDLIFPEVGELVGGSEREDVLDVLLKQMKETGIEPSKMEWYLSTRKWGSVPHAGFGIGFERLLMFITKMPKIHDVIPFPVSF